MDLKFSIKNFRCFGEVPGQYELRTGATAFLGPNNSGKTTIGKLLFCLRPLFEQLSKAPTFNAWMRTPQIIGPANNGSGVSSGAHPEFRNWACRHTKGVCELTITAPQVGTVNFLFDLRALRVVRVNIIVKDGGFELRADGRAPEVSTFTLRDGGNTKAIDADGQITTLLNETHALIAPLFETLARVTFVSTGRHTQNVTGDGVAAYDMCLGKPLFEMWRKNQTQGDPAVSKMGRELLRTIGRIFDDEGLSLLTQEEDSTLLVIMGDEQYRIDEVGNGIGQFVTIGINLMSRSPSYVFIDEPETGLHPQLQRAMVEFIESIASDGVLFATHSIGLARATAEYLYSVTTGKDHCASIKPFERAPKLPEFLGEMSFSTYQELGFSRLLFVEGKSDVGPIRQWLRELNNDHEVVVFSLGGSSGISALPSEIGEAKRVCENISVILDRDTDDSNSAPNAERIAAKAACDEAGVPVLILERRALENYFPDNAVKKALGPTATALEPFERPKAKWAEFGYGKSHHNPAIAAEIRVEDLKGTDLFRFLITLTAPVAGPLESVCSAS